MMPGAFLVSRHKDVLSVLKQPAIFSSTTGVDVGASLIASSFVTKDAPEHTRLRGLVSRNFAPRVIETLDQRVRQVCEKLIDEIAVGGKREMDLIAEFSRPLPLVIIADLLGIDPQEIKTFRGWSDDLLASAGNPFAVPEEQLSRTISEFSRYFTDRFHERIPAPGGDLLSQLTRAEEGDKPMKTADMLSYVALLLIAGNETTANLLGNALIALTDFPEQLAKVQAQPALIPQLVEEALRYNGPAPIIFRRVLTDTELAGVTISKKSQVMLLLSSANRDEAFFSDPDRLDIERDTRGHVAFGLGPHFCLGAPLARLETTIALEVLLTRLQDFRRLSDPVDWRKTPLIRGPATLPLSFKLRK
jgi:cytochrome P450